MSPATAKLEGIPAEATVQFVNLKKEAEMEPDPVHKGPVTKETQIIAIYGKGGIGKSFTLANLSYMMAQQIGRAHV